MKNMTSPLAMLCASGLAATASPELADARQRNCDLLAMLENLSRRKGLDSFLENQEVNNIS